MSKLRNVAGTEKTSHTKIPHSAMNTQRRLRHMLTSYWLLCKEFSTLQSLRHTAYTYLHIFTVFSYWLSGGCWAALYHSLMREDLCWTDMWTLLQYVYKYDYQYLSKRSQPLLVLCGIKNSNNSCNSSILVIRPSLCRQWSESWSPPLSHLVMCFECYIYIRETHKC